MGNEEEGPLARASPAAPSAELPLFGRAIRG
jgi:hypothetical protein